jgi:MFS family permease
MLGADDSFIALMSSCALLLGTVQLISPILGGRVRNKKKLILGLGIGEVFWRCSTILIPFIFLPPAYLPVLLLMVGASLTSIYIASPFHGTWIANTVPERIRARFFSRQTIITSIVAVVAGFSVGQFLDLFPESEKYTGFSVVFAIGAAAGLLGYLFLFRAPWPRQEPDQEGVEVRSLHMLIRPFRDSNFRRAILFLGSWNLTVGIAGPLYSVFMLQWLGISYTEIALFNGLFVVSSITGNRVWANLVDRFGSKPVLQILMVPAALIPFGWILNEPGQYYFVPISLFLAGFVFSGIGVAVTPLQYSLLPEGDLRPYYLACWSSVVNLMAAGGPLIGGLLALYLRDIEFQLFGLTVTSLKIIFVISALLRLLPLIQLQYVRDRSTLSSGRLLAQMFQGNILSYAYNAAVYGIASHEQRRARATLALGRSGSPLALEQLTQALADASPVVRRSAARALGETGFESATQHLIAVLIDGSSDIRPEAAEALGRLGHSVGVDPLVDALEDADPRVRMSAIRGLSEIKGPDVRELLFWYFSGSFDRLTFPTLVDVLSQLGDHRVVKPTMQRLDSFSSAAVRLQLLNSVTRALGASNEFYRLLSLDDTTRVDAVTRLLRRTGSTITGSKVLASDTRSALKNEFTLLSQAFDREDIADMESATRRVSILIRDGLRATTRQPFEVLSVFLVILAVEDFLRSEAREDLGGGVEIFLAVCLKRIGELLRELGR